MTGATGQPGRLVVRCGDTPVSSPLVSVPVATLQAHGVGHDIASLVLIDEESGGSVPVQLSVGGTEVHWIVPGIVAPGAPRRFALAPAAATSAPPGGSSPGVVQKMDRLVFTIGGRERARYTFLGARRPYWWPLVGPRGASVVRGQGSEDHPHHTGLTLAYGGHGEGGSTNIWSDWDEEPYGPGGRMVHTCFHSVGCGPVYAEATEGLTYLNARGDPFCDEVRRQRVWAGADGTLFLDLETTLTMPRGDPGTHPFLLAARLPASMDVRGTGQVISSEGPRREGEQGEGAPAGRWVDGSGPLDGGWGGVAMLDHPGNYGFPALLYKYAVMEQLTQCHYPPPDAVSGTFTLRRRVYTHAGDAREARVDEQWAAYANGMSVSVAEGS